MDFIGLTRKGIVVKSRVVPNSPHKVMGYTKQDPNIC